MMYSLVKFDNGEYYVLPSKQVKIIQGKNCIIKYKNRAKYSGCLIEISGMYWQFLCGLIHAIYSRYIIYFMILIHDCHIFIIRNFNIISKCNICIIIKLTHLDAI